MDLWDAGALGLVETHGLAASIVAVDVMTKAAEVRVIGVRRIGGGLVTVSFIGDMASVTAAVESARLAVAAIGGTVVATVIGRPAVPTNFIRDRELPGVGETHEPPADEPRADPEVADADPAVAGGGPQVVDADPQVADADPKVVGGGPKRRAARTATPRRRPSASGPMPGATDPPADPPAGRPRGR